jgi:putative IMPACT (imprinted ancient) family translation regulator
MLLTKIDVAEAEAQRFLDRVRALKAKINGNQFALDFGSKETAAVRRASMDLTRALAEMRKS